MQQATREFRRCFVGGSLRYHWIRQIDPFMIPDELVFGSKVEVKARHVSPSLLIDGTIRSRDSALMRVYAGTQERPRHN
jgi:hypothetical protein